jgi:hypothetical protein
VEPAFGGIGLEQDAGVGQLASGGLPGGDQVLERLPFFGGEGDFEPFHDSIPGPKVPKRIGPKKTCKSNLADY